MWITATIKLAILQVRVIVVGGQVCSVFPMNECASNPSHHVIIPATSAFTRITLTYSFHGPLAAAATTALSSAWHHPSHLYSTFLLNWFITWNGCRRLLQSRRSGDTNEVPIELVVETSARATRIIPSAFGGRLSSY